MTYSTTTIKKDGDGVEYGIQWKGKFDPIATCTEWRNAQRICDALNNVDDASSFVALDWIRVEDRMPDDGMMVLCHIAEDDMRMACHDDGKWWDGDCLFIRSKITHWCEPVPPSNQPLTTQEESK